MFKRRQSTRDDIILSFWDRNRSRRKPRCLNWWPENNRISIIVFLYTFLYLCTIRDVESWAFWGFRVPFSETSEKALYERTSKRFFKGIYEISWIVWIIGNSYLFLHLLGRIPEVSRRRMAIAYMLRPSRSDNPMSETWRARNNEIVSSEIYFFHWRRHERQRKTRFTCQRKKYLSRSVTTDTVFWKNRTYFFLVIHQRKYICFWIHLHDFQKYPLRTSELDQHLLDDGYFHDSGKLICMVKPTHNDFSRYGRTCRAFSDIFSNAISHWFCSPVHTT